LTANTPTLIDAFLPAYDVAERHQMRVRARIEQVYAAVRRLDLGGSGVVRMLFWFRELPAFFLRPSNWGAAGRLGLTLDVLLDSGFVLLGERPNEELVLGLVGRFWTPSGDIQRLTLKEFRNFQRPGYAKAVWNFSLSGQAGGTTLLTTETRVLCLDATSRKRFLAYWSFVGPFSGLIRRRILRSIKRQAEGFSPPIYAERRRV
jgi:hypothetical protein